MTTEPATPELSQILGSLAETSGGGVALCRGGRIGWASSGLAELVGRRSVDELVGEPLDSLFEPEECEAEEGGQPEAGSQIPSVLCRPRGPCAGTTRVRLRRLRLELGDSWELWLAEEVAPSGTSSEGCRCLAGTLDEAVDGVADLREKLRREVAQREELLSVLSHELRTPVTVISGYQRLLLSEQAGELNPEQRRFLQESDKSCKRLESFIDSLLEASRGVSGTEKLELRPASLEPAVAGVMSLLRPLLEERELTATIDLDPEALWAELDPIRIEQVFTNLIGNAIKYAQHGGSIELATCPVCVAGERFVEVSVSDDGPGVAAPDRDRIFEPYVRVSRASAPHGLGLGLAICKRLVELHGGSIQVTDRPGGGSCFRFTLRAAKEKQGDL